MRNEIRRARTATDKSLSPNYPIAPLRHCAIALKSPSPLRSSAPPRLCVKFAPPYPNAPAAHYNGCVKIVIISLAALLASLAAFVGCAAVGASRSAPELERRAHELNKTIMCPLCPGESIDQSQNPLSAQMRAIVAEKLAEGWSDDQIRDFFVERYGQSVLLEPPREGFGLTAWIVPPAAFALALAALLIALRRMSSSRAAGGGDDDDDGGAARAGYLARLRNALETPDADSRDALSAKDGAGGKDAVR